MLLELPMQHSETLRRMQEWGVHFETFFDVGAAKGNTLSEWRLT